MDNVEFYKQNINQIFTCLGQLDTYLEDHDNSAVISSLNDYKDDLVAFSQLISADSTSNNDNEVGDTK